MMATLNPYEPPASLVNDLATNATLDLLAPRISERTQCRTKTFWPHHNLRLYSDRLEIDTTAIPLEQVVVLRSQKLFPMFRCLIIELEGCDRYQTLEFQPACPADWYCEFESLGLPTEDEHDYRHAWQIGRKLDTGIAAFEATLGALFVLALLGACVTACFS